MRRRSRPGGPLLTRPKYMRRRSPLQGPTPDFPMRNSIALCGMQVNASAIARAQGMTQPYVSMIINGVREAKMGYYLRIASAIGVSVDELLDGIHERKAQLLEQADL